MPRANRWEQLRFLTVRASRLLPSFLVRSSETSAAGQQLLDSASVARTSGLAQERGLPAWLLAGTNGNQAGRDLAQQLTSAAGQQLRCIQHGFETQRTAKPAFPPISSIGRSSFNVQSPLDLTAYPRPVDDNGRGIHWIPTLSSPPEVVDRFLPELKAMHMRWVVLLNNGTQIGANDYLVQRLVEAGIMPIMRIYTPGGAPIQGDLDALVRHYRALGVHYFQLYNEPNLRVENEGQPPDVGRYLDRWVPAARTVVAAGGLPGFGALSPMGDVEDLAFLREALSQLKTRGELDVLNRAWLSVHNYGRDYLRVREYDRIVRELLGRSLPMIGTEGGIYPGGNVTEEEQQQVVSDAYRHMAQREPYYFAYSYWVLANEAGGGHDTNWSHQALFRPDGVSPLVDMLRMEA